LIAHTGRNLDLLLSSSTSKNSGLFLDGPSRPSGRRFERKQESFQELSRRQRE